MMNIGRLIKSTNSSITRRCLSVSSACSADNKLSLFNKVDLDEIRRPGDLKKREMLINSTINVDVPLDVSQVASVPLDHLSERRVRIFKQAKNAMQSATFDTKNWKIEFETRERWENPLMGWGSSGDPLSNMVLQFSDLEDAVEFCNKNNWTYFVDSPQTSKKPRMKSYAENFAWNKRTRIGSK